MLKFISNWKAEERREYLVSKLKVKKLKEAIVSEKETKNIISIYVDKSTENGYLIDWDKFKTTESFLKKIFRKIFRFRIGEIFSLSYETNKAGNIEELIDTDDLDFQIQLVEETLKEKWKTENEQAFIEDTMDSGMVKARLLKTVEIFHFPYGKEFTEDGKVEAKEIPNLMMKENDFPVELINTLIYYDEETQIGEVQIERKYDQLALNKIMKETLTEIDTKLAINRNPEQAPLFVNSETFWYKVDFKSGWIINAKYEKVHMTKEGENIEQIEIALMEET